MSSLESAKPLVYAYIGTQDPMRGDSRARVGIAKTTAEILGGEYLYVDEATLKEHFPNVNGFKERLQRFVEERGLPDILVGHDASDFFAQQDKKPSVLFEYVPESIASKTSEKGYTPTQLKGIVAHDLTPQILETEAQDFRQHYQDLKAPLVAVMMGGDFSKSDVTKAATLMRRILKNYDEISVFVCPSRRTDEQYGEFMDVMENGAPDPLHLNMLINNLNKIFNIKNKAPKLDWGDNVQLHGVDYEKCTKGYNPYMGLLASADHIIVLGRSQSLISEALYTGKTVMHAAGPHCEMHGDLYEMGIIKDLRDVARTGQFNTQEIEPISTVHESAERLAQEYIDQMDCNIT